MKAPLFIIAGILGLVLAVVACDDPEEDLAPVLTPTSSGSTAPVVTLSPTAAPPGTPVPVPSGWQTYDSPEIGLSLSHPADMEFTDLSPTQSPGMVEKYVQFRSPTDQKRSFSIAVVTKPPAMTLDEWVRGATACLPDTINREVIAGRDVITCQNLAEDIPTAAVIFEARGLVFFSTSVMPAFGYQSDFDRIVQSLRVQ